jgi:tetratricopeptide (TPR) repeat protein
MISWFPALRSFGTIGIALLVSLSASAAPAAPAGGTSPVVLVTVGMGPPPPAEGSSEPSTPALSALDDSRKKAILLYLYKTLGPDEFSRLKDAINALVLPDYEKYCVKTETISVASLPGGDLVVLKAAVTVDAAALSAYIENIKKLQPKPETPRALTAGEKEILFSKAQAIYIQAEVASDILLDRLRGIESFLAAQTIFETAGSSDGIYRCLMGTGRARASLGDIAAARDDFERALEIAGGLKRPDYMAAARVARARLALASGDPAGALRELNGVLDDASLSSYEGIYGDASLLEAEIEYADGDYGSARTALDRAITTLEGLADIKRLTRAHLLRGLIDVAEGDGTTAVGAFKTAKILADKLDDAASGVKALVGIARAYRTAGDPKSASLYLSDALKTARDSGWVGGEIASLCESARAQMDLGDPAGAKTSAAEAHDLALSLGDPAPLAAALLVLADACRALGQDDEALDALISYEEVSADVRVTGSDVPFLRFGDAERDAALGRALDLAVTLGKEKKIVPLIAAHEGSALAADALADPPPLSRSDAALTALFRDAAMRAIAAEAAALDGDYAKMADTSRAEIVRIKDEANRSLTDIRARIVRESPPLAALFGMKNRDAADIARDLPEGAALVTYLVYGDNAFARVITRDRDWLVRLGGGYDDIKTATEKMNDVVKSTTAGGTGEISLSFTEAATALSSLLITPILPKLAGVMAIGISPPASLPSLPIQAMGRYNDEGGFVFLGREYALFETSSLSPRLAQPSPSGTGADARDILIVGGDDLLSAGPETPQDGHDSGAGEGDTGSSDAAGAETPRVVHIGAGGPWWESGGGLTVLTDANLWGESDFSRIEYLSVVTDRPVLIVPGGGGAGEGSAFLNVMTAGMGQRTILGAYTDAARSSAEASLSGGDLHWVLFTLISNFVSKQR